MLDQKLYETIEAYLNGDLKGSDLSDFETRLQSDKELALQVSMFRDIDSAVNDKPVLNFQKLVEEQGNNFLQEKNQKKTVVKNINWRKYLIAAAAMILLVGAIFIIKNQLNSQLTGQDLFAQHFESYDLDESLRGTNDLLDLFDSGIEKYQAGNFEEASTIFQQLSDNDPSDMIVAFCLANSYLNQKPSDFAKASIHYEKVIQEGNSIYVSASKWYTALILLAQDDQAGAEKLLYELNNEGGNWGIKAKELTKKLEQID